MKSTQIDQDREALTSIAQVDHDRVDALIYIGKQIEQRLAGLETRMDKQQKLMDLLHERFAARPVLVTWLIFAGIPAALLIAGILR